MRKIALYQAVTGGVGLPIILEEVPAGGGIAAQPLPLGSEQYRHVVADLDAVAREIDRGLQQVLPCQAAETLVRLPHTGDSARDAGGEVTVERSGFIHLAVLIEVHVAARPGRGRLSVVDCDGLVIGCGVHEHEPATTQVAGARIGHGQRKTNGNGSVDGVAALLEYLRPDPGRIRVLRGDHAGIAKHRMGRVAIANDRRIAELSKHGATREHQARRRRQYPPYVAKGERHGK